MTSLDSIKTRLSEFLLGESPDAIVATTPDGTVAYWSKGAETILGYTSGEAVGRSIYETIVPPDRVGNNKLAGIVARNQFDSKSVAGYVEGIRK